MPILSDPSQGWRSAPDCATCGDTGRYRDARVLALDVTPELVEEMVTVHDRNYRGVTPTIAARTGMAAVLEVLRQRQGGHVTEAHCLCKRGRRASERWVADKHGYAHPDEPEPDPDDDAPY